MQSQSSIGSTRGRTVYLTPKDIISLGLGPLSSSDAKYLEWLGAEYGEGVKIIVRKGWRDFFGLAFGYD
jgi:hypothetical protein